MAGEAPLRSLAHVLAPLLASAQAASPILLPVDEAGGLVLTETVRAPAALPSRATALRSGLAVASLDLVGASPHAPVMLMAKPALVQAGEALPSGCDAVLDPAALDEGGALPEMTATVPPGSHVRFAGHDLAEGTILARAGERLTPEQRLACRLAGVGTVTVRRPAIALALPESAEAQWLAECLRRLGCAINGDQDTARLVIGPAGNQPRLALQPGEACWANNDGGRLRLDLPQRFDGFIGGYLALALPVLARLLGQAPRSEAARLGRKISSAIGASEIVLLRLREGVAEPLAIGEITLAALAEADAFAIIDAGSEGLAVGEALAVTRLDDPLGPADAGQMR